VRFLEPHRSSGVFVNATTGTWAVTSSMLGTTAALYARATQSDATGNTATSAAAGSISQRSKAQNRYVVWPCESPKTIALAAVTR